MASKENSFFLGMENGIAKTDMVDNQYFTTSVDVSSYTDIPRGRLLRIKSVQWRFTTASNEPLNPQCATQKAVYSEMDISYHLSTARKDYPVSLADTNVVSSGIIYYLADHAQDVWLDVINADDATPDNFEDGFICASDNLYLSWQTENFDVAAHGLKISAQLECEVTTINRSQALAIAIAQATSSG
jgi:hypothetical protein